MKLQNGGKINDLMEDKTNLESEIEESKNKNENCKSDLAISKTKSVETYE